MIYCMLVAGRHLGRIWKLGFTKKKKTFLCDPNDKNNKKSIQKEQTIGGQKKAVIFMTD